MKRDKHLIGKGGVGLVMFHLARLGIEFSETLSSSASGDLWIRLDDGRTIAAEVKTTTAGGWHLRAGQIETAAVFFFVNLPTGRLYVIDRQQLQQLRRASRQKGSDFSVTVRALSESAYEDWSALGRLPEGKRLRLIRRTYAAVTQGNAPERIHVVRRRLADGSIKEYRYPRNTPPVFSNRFPDPVNGQTQATEITTL